MRILISNDDGINNSALWALVRALQPLGEVIVAAPDRNRSGVGTGLTLHDPVRFREIYSRADGVRAYGVEGTPGDAVIMGLRHLAGGPVDAVVTGINPGNNVSHDVLISGTVGAALQGYLNGAAAMAVSVGLIEEADDETVQAIVRSVAAELAKKTTPRPFLANLNFPRLVVGPIRGARKTIAAPRPVEDRVEPGGRGNDQHFWILRRAGVHADYESLPPDSDISALHEGFVSISSLSWQLASDIEEPALDRLVEAACSALA
ncbi:MAG: 5'/3'-nucleotidase SurE [Dehalococcoidia bacterium]